MRQTIERVFGVKASGSTLTREINGGIATFLALSYIIVVQPAMLSTCGMDPGGVLFATCVGSALATLAMGLMANYPIAIAPGMGHNTIFAFLICGTLGIPWQTALALVFLSGVLFLVLSLTKFREAVFDAVPQSLRSAIPAGIGLLISLVGLQWAGVVTNHPQILVQLGELHYPPTLVAVVGLATMAVLHARGLPGAVPAGMAASAICALAAGLIRIDSVVGMPPDPTPTLLAFNLFDALGSLPIRQLIELMLLLFFLDLFDTVGTLVGVAKVAGLLDRDGKLPRASRAFAADAGGTVIGSLLGTSTLTSYVESAAGVSEGARTGLASVVTAGMFLLCLPLAPLVGVLGTGLPAAPGAPEGTLLFPIVAPALIYVGILMLETIRDVDWADPTEAVPAALAVMIMPFTLNITEGIAWGFIAHVLLKVCAGRRRELQPLAVIIAGAFMLRYMLGLA